MCAEEVASTVLSDVTWGYAKNAISVNRWIALKKLRGIEAIRGEVLQWDISALQKQFELARSVLLDEPAAVQLARDMLQSEEIDQTSIDSWPLFEDIRDDINRDESEDVETTDYL